MIKVGLTGNICAGKSLIEKMLEEFNIPVFNADKITYKLLENDPNVINQVENLLKDKDIKTVNKKLDRRKIGKIVFDNIELLRELEKIIHPIVIEEINNFFEINKDKKIVVASVPLLFEANLTKLVDKILLVTVGEKEQLERLMKRNDFSKEEAMQRIDAQMQQKFKIKYADFIINNSQTIEYTKNQLVEILDILNKQ